MHCIGEYVGRISVFYRHVGMTMKGISLLVAAVLGGRSVCTIRASVYISVYIST